MKNILCFGDSNTWGYVPGGDGRRYNRNERWTGRLQSKLGDDYYVIEEGLNSRTVVWDDPIKGDKSGLDYIVPCLQSHKPLDLVVIMLGSNDCKERFSLDGYSIGRSLTRIMDAVLFSRSGREGKAPEILLIAPPPMKENPIRPMAEMGGKAYQRSIDIVEWIEFFAKEYGVYYLEAGSMTGVSSIDGLHLDADGHKKMAEGILKKVREIVG